MSLNTMLIVDKHCVLKS